MMRVGLLGLPMAWLVVVLTGPAVMAHAMTGAVQTGGRVEVPEAGFTLSVPDDLTVIFTDRADPAVLAREVALSHPGVAQNIEDYAAEGFLAAWFSRPAAGP